MSWPSRHPGTLASAGLLAGPLAWAIAAELGLALPYAECHASFRPLLILTLLLTGAALWGGVLSWRAPWPGRVGWFARALFALLAVALAYAILLQALASALLTGCER